VHLHFHSVSAEDVAAASPRATLPTRRYLDKIAALGKTDTAAQWGRGAGDGAEQARPLWGFTSRATAGSRRRAGVRLVARDGMTSEHIGRGRLGK